jgi:hypothetical protein
MRSAASKTRLRKLSTINGHHLHNVRPPQLAASLFLSRRRDVAYADVATWLQLGPLVEVQKNLRALRAQIRAAADDSSAVRRIDTQLAREPPQFRPRLDRFGALRMASTSTEMPIKHGRRKWGHRS